VEKKRDQEAMDIFLTSYSAEDPSQDKLSVVNSREDFFCLIQTIGKLFPG
jgi:hypothetical protein